MENKREERQPNIINGETFGYDAQNILNQAIQLHGSGKLQEAKALYSNILQHDPDNAYAIHSLGVLALQQENDALACSRFQRAIDIQPDDSIFQFNLGFVLYRQGETDKAILHFKRAISLNPDYTDAYHQLGNLLKDLGRIEEAIAYQDGAIRIRSDYAEAHFNKATSLLLLGELGKGFTEYEWRWHRKDNQPQNFAQPRWDGSEVSGKIILIHAEQGLGDTIQFFRYMKFAKERGGEVIAVVQDPLVNLLSNSSDVDSVVSLKHGFPKGDLHAPLMSLPYILNTSLKTIPAEVPYIFADSELINMWRHRLSKNEGLKIGLCWQANSIFEKQHQQRITGSPKSIPPEKFYQIGQPERVAFYNLQKDIQNDSLQEMPEHFRLYDFGPDFDQAHGPFMDSAAVMQNLDLVITIDTAVAHLAGALGVPVWVLLPYVPDWRWLLGRNDSPWYPTMRLFRQPKPGDWDTVVKDVEKALASILRPGMKLKGASEVSEKGGDHNGDIEVEISYGEFIDKLTILRIKSERMTDPLKRANVLTELELLQSTFEEQIYKSEILERLIEELTEVNKQLWDIEDAIREKESQKAFDQNFIDMARSVYFNNDQRAKIKGEISRLLGSNIIEEKSYTAY